jgi:histidine triad (HIT) family protein
MNDPGCLFCKIARGDIPVQRLAEDEHGVAFPDINPQAPVHVLVVPKEHVASLKEAEGKWELVGRLHALALRVAREKGIDATGFRTVVNTGRDAQQTVLHVHLHLLGGRPMGWPPG